MKREFKEITPKSRSDFRNWLSKHHAQSESIWVVIFKADSGRSNLTAADVAEEALCFGWIDSVPNKLDHHRYKLRVSPRRAASGWSALNKKRVKKLIGEGLMTPHGLKKIELAKSNGAWAKLNASDRLEVPKELAALFKKNKQANDFFQSIAPSSKRAILEWIYGAKTEVTKLKRIQETVRLAAKGIRANNYLDLKKLKSERPT
jgi:uncharacterized protein YdeI (YjbR/CyaY-like superfamily)